MYILVFSLLFTLILLIGLFYLLNKFTRKINYLKNKKIFRYFLVFIFSVIIYFSTTTLLINLYLYTPDLDFNQKKWETEQFERYRMLDDLIDSNIIIGKSKPEITDILGEPKNKEENIWYYEIYGKGFFEIYTIKINVYFENNKVAKVEQQLPKN